MQCDKEEYQHHFLEKVELSPERKSYNVGDTIWLQYSNPDNRFFDRFKRLDLGIDSALISFELKLNAQYNTPVGPPDGFCDFVTAGGVNNGRYLYDYRTSLSTMIGCDNNAYNFKIGVVLKQKGIYSLEMPLDFSLQSCPLRANRIPLSRIEYQFNIIDGNKEVYQAIPLSLRMDGSGYMENEIDNKRAMMIQVD